MDVIVVHGYWLDELTGLGVKQSNGRPATIMFDPVPLLGANATKTPNLRDLTSNAHLKTRTRVATVDPETGYYAAQLVASNDPDLDAYSGRKVTFLGEDPFTIEVPYNASTVTVSAEMAAKTGLTQGSSVKAIWLPNASVTTIPTPTPPNNYLTSTQTLANIAAGIETHDEDPAAHADIRALIPAAYTDEQARDALSSALVAGSNVTITPNDGGDTITISVTVPASYSDEQAQDAFAALIAAGTHSGISFAYNDAGNALSATVAAQSWSQITGKPTFAAVATSGSASDITTGTLPDGVIPAGIARDTEVAAAVAGLVNSAPTTLDTLGEIATALQADESAAATLTAAVGGKASAFTQSATKIANYTAADNEIVPLDTSGGTFTLTGPTSGKPFGYRWKAGTTAPTIAAPAGYTISGAASVTPGLAPSTSSGELVLWQAFGTDYQPLGGFKPQSALNTANDGRYVPKASLAVNVKDYGATGDGTTDDTASIHAARNSGATAIFFPRGTYSVSGLVANVAGQHWRLDPLAVIKQADSALIDLITISAADVNLTGGYLTGNRPVRQAAGSARSQAIYVTGARVSISDVTVSDAAKAGILGGDGCNDLRLRHVRVLNSLENGVCVKSTAANITGLDFDDIYIDRTGLSGAPGTGSTSWKQGGFKLLGSDDSVYKISQPEVGRVVVKLLPDNTLYYSANGTVAVELWDVDGGNFDSLSTYGGHCGVSIGRSSQHIRFGSISIRKPIIRGLEYGNNTTTDQYFTFGVVKIYGGGVTCRAVNTGGINRHNSFAMLHIYDCGIDFDSTMDGAGGGTGSIVTGSGIGANFAFTSNTTFGQVYARISTGTGAVFNLNSGSSVDIGSLQLERPSANGHGIRFTAFSRCTVSSGAISTTTRDIYIDASSGTVDGIRFTGCRIFNLQVALTGSAVLGTANNLINCNYLQDGKDADIIQLATAVPYIIDAKGTGTPEAVVTAAVGSRFRRTDGGAGTTLYVKESGTGNTGWVAK